MEFSCVCPSVLHLSSELSVAFSRPQPPMYDIYVKRDLCPSKHQKDTYINQKIKKEMHSLLHLECHFFNLNSQSLILFSRFFLPRSIKRPVRLKSEIEIGWHSNCSRLYTNKKTQRRLADVCVFWFVYSLDDILQKRLIFRSHPIVQIISKSPLCLVACVYFCRWVYTWQPHSLKTTWNNRDLLMFWTMGWLRNIGLFCRISSLL